MCEKPLAMTSADAAADGGRLPGAGVILVGGVHVSAAIRRGWRSASLSTRDGSAACSAIQSWFRYYNDDPSNIRNIREVGGGALYDIGCYNVNLSRMLFSGEPTSVKASRRARPADGR